MNDISTDELQAYFRWFLTHLGLSTFNIELSKEALSPSLKLVLHTKFKLDYYKMPTNSADVVKYLHTTHIKPILDSIENSEAIQLMKSDLLGQIVKLEKEVSELRPLKHYFDVEMKLRHGGDVSNEKK